MTEILDFINKATGFIPWLVLSRHLTGHHHSHTLFQWIISALLKKALKYISVLVISFKKYQENDADFYRLDCGLFLLLLVKENDNALYFSWEG